MHNLYTIIVEFEQGTYCSQYFEKCEFSALKMWLNDLYNGKIEINFEKNNEFESVLKSLDKPILLTNLKNIWFSYINIDNDEFFINIVKTNNE